MSAIPPLAPPATALRTPPWRAATLLLAVALLIAGILVDRHALARPLLAEGHPQFDPVHGLRTLLMLLAAAFTVIGLLPDAQSRGAEPWADEAVSPETMQRVLWVVMGLNGAFVVLFLLAPGLYYRLGREDRPVEYASFLLLMGAAGVFVLAGRGLRGRRDRPATLSRWVAYGLGAVCFVVAMEEISWGQRLLQIRSPEVFRQHNLQKELNFHNFITSETENAYYQATFLLLVLLPFAVAGLPWLRRHPVVASFTPGPRLMVAAAMPMAYSYDLWNITFTQYAFFATVLVLLATAHRWRARDRSLSDWALAMALACVVTQALHLAYGDRQARVWDVSEYKEFFIPLLLFVCAAQALRRLQRSGAPDAGRVRGKLPGG